MLLMSAAMPISWRIGLWVALALAGVSIVKIVAEKKIGNKALCRGLRIPLYAGLAYWIMLVVGILYSNDTATAWQVIVLKAGLLIFPLCFLLTDTTYLTAKHLRGCGYALLVSVCGVFLFFSVKAAIKMMGGATLTEVTGSYTFDPRHHAYTALYMTVAIVFALHEINRHWQEMKVWYRILMAFSLGICMLYVMIVNSRAGSLTMWVVTGGYVVFMAIFCKQWKLALLVCLLFAGVVLGMKALVPKHTNRVEVSVSEMSGGNEDVRMKIYKAALHSAVEEPVVGHGTGDYYQLFLNNSINEIDGYAAKNVHNQYLETILSTGIIGLIPFLMWLIWPIGWAWFKKNQNFFFITMMVGVVMFNLLFESMLERQMGLLFIGFLLSLIVLILSLEENKFGSVAKS